MHEDELRALVREALARHLHGGHGGVAPQPSVMPSRHASHAVFPLAAANDDGMCVIEPAVPCTHCNYCKSLGH